MNAARLLEHFDRISDAADAVPSLRRFVLDLAVRGKLVEQDPADASAQDLLISIAARKGSAISSRSTPASPKKGSSIEPWCSIPNSWIYVRLDEITNVVMGSSPPGSTYNTSGEGIPLINGPVEFTAGPFGRTRVNQYTTAPTAFCDEGDFLICVRGSTTGRTNIAAFRACIGRGVAAIQPLFPDQFVRLAIRVRQEAILQMGRGIAFPSISREQLAGLPIPLPPLAEQQRIVAKVDELMALCDRLEAAQAEREARRDRLVAASLARVSQPAADAGSDARAAGFHLDHFARLTTRPEHVKHLRQSILNLAVRGRLVPQDPKDPPLSPLLDRMAAAKAAHLTRSGSVKNVSTPTPLSSSKAPWLIPASWGWFSFGDVAISRDAERIPVSKEQRSGLAKTYDYYGASGVIDKIDRYLFDKPLLLIGEDGANLINRSTPIAFIARGEYWVNNHAHVLDGESEDLLRFLELHINAIDLKPFVTGTAQPKMNQAKMNSIPIALPPLAEQRRIVAKVDELMALCDQLEASLAAAATDRARLLESLLHEALAPAA
jgi:type I restriction enzyme S subunit